MPTILLAVGGSHGDFLFSCCKLMLNQYISVANDAGRISAPSEWKELTLKCFKEGKKIFNVPIPTNSIEMSHTWYKEFKEMPCKFYYIDYEHNQINILKKMWIDKNYTSRGKNKEDICKDMRECLENNLAKKINKNNIDKFLTNYYKNQLKKFKQQPGIIAIKITNLYKFESLVNTLKKMGFWNDSNVEQLKKHYKGWFQKNINYIEEVTLLATK